MPTESQWSRRWRSILKPQMLPARPSSSGSVLAGLFNEQRYRRAVTTDCLVAIPVPPCAAQDSSGLRNHSHYRAVLRPRRRAAVVPYGRLAQFLNDARVRFLMNRGCLAPCSASTSAGFHRPQGRVDLIVAVNVLRRQPLRRCASLLKAGGRLIV